MRRLVNYHVVADEVLSRLWQQPLLPPTKPLPGLAVREVLGITNPIESIAFEPTSDSTAFDFGVAPTFVDGEALPEYFFNPPADETETEPP